MKSILKLVVTGFISLVFFGCAQNYYNIPKETYEKKVRVLGVAPIFVDGESDIRHPEKQALVNVVKELNRKNERELLALLKNTGVYFSVQLLPNDPDQLYSALYFRRERRDDAGIIYNKHFFKGPELKELIRKNDLDALMVVVVSGLTKHGRRYSSNILHYMESDYNNLVMTAQILDAEGNILWEFPNFRQQRLSFPTFFALQYPNFDEAAANASDKVEVVFKSIPGITRALNKTEKSAVQSNIQVSSIYAAAFDEIVSLLRPDMKLFSWKGKDSKTGNSEEAKPASSKPEETAK